MDEITILSGKGGTGKTTLTAAFTSIAENAVFCDNDVDAANLYLILQPEIKEEHSFDSGWVVTINEEKCTNCGICLDYCRFDAIYFNDKENLEINTFQCEGCRLCERICPMEAITSKKNKNNYWYVSDTRFGPFIHAKMCPGEENSGKLVTQVRKKAVEIARNISAKYIINDGPAGIGCPVIASLAGTRKVLMVIEPSLSGLHDAQRLVNLVRMFDIKIYAVINKYNINKKVTQNIEKYLQENTIPVTGKIPFHTDLVKSMIQKKSIVEFNPESEITRIIRNIWLKISNN
jgi:MinD superfamily P-loop ATPase